MDTPQTTQQALARTRLMIDYLEEERYELKQNDTLSKRMMGKIINLISDHISELKKKEKALIALEKYKKLFGQEVKKEESKAEEAIPEEGEKHRHSALEAVDCKHCIERNLVRIQNLLIGNAVEEEEQDRTWSGTALMVLKAVAFAAVAAFRNEDRLY